MVSHLLQLHPWFLWVLLIPSVSNVLNGRGSTGLLMAPASYTHIMSTQTLAQVISGAGTPLERQGREMGVPSIVLNT